MRNVEFKEESKLRKLPKRRNNGYRERKIEFERKKE
jgi:hypothetical protein